MQVPLCDCPTCSLLFLLKMRLLLVCLKRGGTHLLRGTRIDLPRYDCLTCSLLFLLLRMMTSMAAVVEVVVQRARSEAGVDALKRRIDEDHSVSPAGLWEALRLDSPEQQRFQIASKTDHFLQ